MSWDHCMVPEIRTIRKKISSSLRVYREDGVGTVIAIAWRQTDLRVRLFAARAITSVNLDGCTFDLKNIPNTPMKLALLREEYESFERRAVRNYVDPEQPVIELGGCIGVVACITNKILKNPESHVVVEANPDVVPLLKENRDYNQCKFEIVNAAITYNECYATFSPEIDFWANSLKQKSSGRTVSVPAICLRDIVNNNSFRSFTLICDIEGHEYDLVMNESDVLQRADVIILETHAQVIGEVKTAQLLDKLKEIGFRKVVQESLVVVMKRHAL